MEDVDQHDPYYVATQMRDYHALQIAPHTKKAWTLASIYNHIFEHRTNPKAIVVQHIKSSEAMLKEIGRYLKLDNQPPDPKVIKAHNDLVKCSEQSLRFLMQINSKR